MVGQNGMYPTSHLPILNMYLCIIEETLAMVEKFQSIVMQKILILFLKD